MDREASQTYNKPMKDITQIKQKYLDLYASKCCNISSGIQCKKTHCSCLVAAQVRAYYETIIPDPYYMYGIKDLHGKDRHGKQLIPIQVLKRAKQQLCNYCWNGIDASLVDQVSSVTLAQKSIIQSRRDNGSNLIISSSDGSQNSKGKTLIASIVMKQAIKSRLTSSNNYHTYDWMQYSVLKDKLHKDPDSLSNQRFCDWLVVDDISRQGVGSRNQRQFVTSLIDPFFQQRLQARLPTIFVFRFDIKQQLQTIQQSFGVAIGKMVHNKNTSLIYIH